MWAGCSRSAGPRNRRSSWEKESKQVSGAGVGAGCMYLVDPDRGRSRRALLRDKTRAAYREVRTSVETAQADLANRARGLVANAKSFVQHEAVDDDQLTARVRAKVGRLVSHPHAIAVTARTTGALL